MITPASGNLLIAPVEALVNTVNTEGVMGKGIALQFKQAFPAVYDDYAAACKAGRVEIGKMHVYDLGGLVGGPRWVINFPTKRHWRSRSRIADIEAGLQDLAHVILKLGIRSIAIPPLGCGHGGLDWNDVRPRIEAALRNSPADIWLYAPAGAPTAAEMPTRTEKPGMTVGRAALIGLIRQYQRGLLDPFVSLLEVHKLMYFLQEAGQPLRLNFSAGKFGPYAANLRQVLIRLEGHWLSGYGDGADDPKKTIDLIGDADAAAERFLAHESEVRERMDRVAELIKGFEDPYGLELLSSVHWVMQQTPDARQSVDAAVTAVQNWNARKRQLLKPEHLRKAWSRLQDAGWGIPASSASQALNIA